MSGRVKKCQWCRASVVWLRSPFGGKWRKFDARPVDARTHSGAVAFPVENERAWKLPLLVEDLRARREVNRETAETEAYDMPWYIPHDCPNNPFKTDQKAEATR